MYDPIAFTLPEGVDLATHIAATYLYQTSASADIHKLAAALSEEQSSGTWVSLEGETPEVRERHVGKIIGIWEIPDHEVSVPGDLRTRDWILQIAYPVHNIGPQIPLMLTTVNGNIASAGRLKLLDLHFPRSYTEQFKGPKFGIEGMRELLGVPDRPLLVAMIKPSIGLTPQQSAEAFYQAAVGGADGVKDDELVVSHPWSHFLDRVREHGAAATAAYEETGHRTLYFVNITDRPDRLVDNAHRALEAGASALMVNYLVVGISALSMLADDPDINVPVLAHLDFSGAIYGSPWSGVSSHLVLGKLPRLAGADLVVYPSPYGKFPFLPAKHLRIAQALTGRFHDIRRSWPMPGGGVQPGMLPLLFGDMGRDFIVGAGGAVHGHPLGPAAGAKALRQAIDAVMANGAIRIEGSPPELAAALAIWGISEAGVKGAYDLMTG
ncbi:MAG TPA: ribulose 1,5-bisphosphate carboxylase [Chloroflexi bacterium]|jgi:2,3-diketo-5-methylthiopentyl-1-phosphate enolase|nr:ribulose 1,5-bisphosphate carboxylase [Chloroflexota bacterium]